MFWKKKNLLEVSFLELFTQSIYRPTQEITYKDGMVGPHQRENLANTGEESKREHAVAQQIEIPWPSRRLFSELGSSQ